MQYIKQLFQFFVLGTLLFSQAHALSATASSTAFEGTASRAVDGNTNGIYKNASVTHTSNATAYEWLLIDLGKPKDIVGIKLWNRTDCCKNRLRNVVIMASKTPFSPATTQAGLDAAITKSDWHESAPNNTNTLTTIPFTFQQSKEIRYILIQKAGATRNDTNFLSLAEVEVIDPHVDLEIKKTAPASAEISSEIAYTITVKNLQIDHAIPAKNIVVRDTLPKGMNYNGITEPNGWTCTYNIGDIECTKPSMAVGESATFILKGTPYPKQGKINNTASIRSKSTEYNLSNNTSTATTMITASQRDLSITKTGPNESVGSAQSFKYQITVKNEGQGQATKFSVTDTLPDTVSIAVAKGTNWSCSLGSTVVCTYNATLNPGEVTPPITITVTAPAIADNTTIEINNTAKMKTKDGNSNNDESTVTTTIVGGTTTGTRFDLVKKYNFNLFGDMVLIGNVNINKLPGATNKPYNDNIDMHFVDYKNKNTIFNQSSDTLNFPSNSTIKWAGLFWEGRLYPRNKNARYDRMPYRNRDDALRGMKTIQFKIHNSSFNPITAQTVHIDRGRTKYNAFADITELLNSQDNPRGRYTVANIPLSEGRHFDGGNYGGWAMLIVYETNNTNNTEKTTFKNISIFQGFQLVNDDKTKFTITDFITPLSGKVTASVAFIAGDGDPVTGGIAKMKKDNNFRFIGGESGSCNPKDNLFNSTICPSIGDSKGERTYGLDVDRVDVSDLMKNNQTSAEFLLSNLAPPRDKDDFTISMFSFITDISTPIINDFNKSAVIIDENGKRQPLNKDSEIYENSKLIYSLTFKNKGTEIAKDVEIFDDFKFDKLERAFNLRNFNVNEIKLKAISGTLGKHSCGYDIDAKRVWCKIDTIAIGDTYKMDFSVRIKDDLSDINEKEQNLTNTAYANYKNATTNEYILLVSDTHGDFGGKSKTLNAGKLVHRSLHHELVDAINQGFHYAADKNITTKVVNQLFNLQLVYLDKDKNATKYKGKDKEGKKYSMPVFLTLLYKDKDKNKTINIMGKEREALPRFKDGDTNISVSNLKIPHAYKNVKIQMHFINWYTILKGKACKDPLELSTTSPYAGIPSCIANDENITKIFKQSCESQEPKYNHKFGCFQYLTEHPENDNNHTKVKFTTISTDNFAVKPKDFDLRFSSSDYPYLLRAGSQYEVNITARDDTNNSSEEYNASIKDINKSSIKYFKNKERAYNNMHGTLEFNSSTAFKDGNLSTNINFSDVGKIDINFTDKTWTEVDRDDFEDWEKQGDCNQSKTYKKTYKNNTSIAIETSLFICNGHTGDPELRFIPHHFEVKPTLYNHRGGYFTYLANETTAMAAHVGAAITAENEQNETTQNFDSNGSFYEQNLSLEMNVTEWNATLITDIQDYYKDQTMKSRHPKSEDINITNIQTAIQLGGFQSGSHAVSTFNKTTKNWEDNITQNLFFNYVRDSNEEVNPFLVPGSDINLNVKARYVNKDKNILDINGTGIGKGKALFLYARAKVARQDDFYSNIKVNAQVKTPIKLLIAYDENNISLDTNPNDYFNASNISTYSSNWYIHLKHDSDKGDGNIQLVRRIDVNPIAEVTQDANIKADSNGVNNKVFVKCIRTGTAQIRLIKPAAAIATPSESDQWIEYNNGFGILYGVECETKSAWSGHGETGHVVEPNAYKRTLKRLSW